MERYDRTAIRFVCCLGNRLVPSGPRQYDEEDDDGGVLTEICGWGSFESADFRSMDSFSKADGYEIFALHVSTIKRVWGGFHLGYVVPMHNAFNVLYLQQVKGRRYRRIGVGVMYGRDAEHWFGKSGIKEIELI